jgi:hypothetical protein
MRATPGVYQGHEQGSTATQGSRALRQVRPTTLRRRRLPTASASTGAQCDKQRGERRIDSRGTAISRCGIAPDRVCVPLIREVIASS